MPDARRPASSAPPTGRRLGRAGVGVVVAGVLIALAVAVAQGDGDDLPGQAAGTPQSAGLTPIGPPAGRHLLLAGRDGEGRWRPPAGRPPSTPASAQENRHAATPAVVSSSWVPGRVADQQVVIGDVALPWRYWLDPSVSAVADEAAVHAALSSWDGAAGSRWATAFAGYAAPGEPAEGGSRSGRAVADGRSTVFVEEVCADLTTANAYLFTDGGVGVDRYGSQVSQILEADIGICPRAVDPAALRLALVHEVGHVVGLAHICDEGDECWQEGMGPGPHGCRVMFWQARPCQVGLDDADRLAVATMYPTLRPLWGPTAADAMARTSFALWGDGEAPAAVVVHPDVGGAVAGGAAALAARLGGPLLQAEPDPATCLSGPGGREVVRVLARRGLLVLVGPWPEGCTATGHDYDVTLRLVPTGDQAAASQRLADLGGPAADVVVWAGPAAPAGTTDPTVVAAAAMAAGRGQPLLGLDGDEVGLAGWLPTRGTGSVVVVGPDRESAAAALRVAVPSVVALDVADPVEVALAAADAVRAHERVGSVVLAGTGGGVEALAAAPAAVRSGAVVVLSGADVDPRVSAWLSDAMPQAGWIVGAGDLPPPATRAAYGALVDG